MAITARSGDSRPAGDPDRCRHDRPGAKRPRPDCVRHRTDPDPPLVPFRVEVPRTPSTVLNPNWNGHAHSKHPLTGESRVTARRDLRRAAFLATYSQRNASPWNPPAAGRLGLELVILWERGRIGTSNEMPDEDNLIASCKALIDGLADGLGINDKRFKFRGVEQDHDPDGRGLVIAIVTPEG